MPKAKDNFKRAYQEHKSNAINRGIAFEISFEEWKAMWCCSGKWYLRGRGADKYCMCRKDDVGPYSIGNVFIGTNKANISAGNLGKVLSPATIQKISDAQKGNPKEYMRGDRNPMHRPEVKAKLSASISGAKHYNSRGVITPEGFFDTARLAAEALGMKKSTVEWRAKYNKFGFSLPA